ncbi:thioredoxin family protein [Desulfolucanica intricata]|uniref:thioredoxin family protein n=1 Tax=Desulfolucanica intricata TaxID=1285191 RepID=UPI00083013AB|nr:thioredoxin family protein [Desulfolucanica intricata]
MEIKLLGVKGCKVCQGLEQTLFDVLAELGVAAAVEKIDDVDEMVRYDVFALPGLVINGKVTVSGRVPGRHEIKTWIKESYNV